MEIIWFFLHGINTIFIYETSIVDKAIRKHILTHLVYLVLKYYSTYSVPKPHRRHLMNKLKLRSKNLQIKIPEESKIVDIFVHGTRPHSI